MKNNRTSCGVFLMEARYASILSRDCSPLCMEGWTLRGREAGAAIYDEKRHAHRRHIRIAHHPGVGPRLFDATVQAVVGYPSRERDASEASVAWVRRLERRPSLAIALWHVCEFQTVPAGAGVLID